MEDSQELKDGERCAYEIEKEIYKDLIEKYGPLTKGEFNRAKTILEKNQISPEEWLAQSKYTPPS